MLLGGAALTRAYVEEDLNDLYDGEVRYAKDAFEGLSLMRRSWPSSAACPGRPCPSRVAAGSPPRPAERGRPRSDRAAALRRRPARRRARRRRSGARRVVKGLKLAEVAAWLDERATFMGQWGLRVA